MALQPTETGLRELALFAGAGGGILGGKLLGWRTVCAVEFAAYPRSVLLARQRDGILENFPVWDDVRTFDGKPWLGSVDVISGGFPCQDISAANQNAKGIDGERSGLWKSMARIIGEVVPRYVFVENSPLLVGRGLAVVLGDLATMGYDARWCVLGAVDCGAPHRRDRIWIRAELANSKGQRNSGQREHGNGVAYQESSWESRGNRICEDLAHAHGTQCKGRELPSGSDLEHPHADTRSGWWANDPANLPESGLGRVVDGVADRVDRLKAIGNGQVSLVAAVAWEILKD